MRRLHVISHPEHEMGGEIYYRKEKYSQDPELREAYECGYKCGRKEAYKEIMEEQYGDYHERSYPRMGRTMPPMMREHDRDWDEPEDVEYRRYRNSMGRFARR